MNMNWYAMDRLVLERVEEALREAANSRRNALGHPPTPRGRLSGLLIDGGRWLAQVGERLDRTLPAGQRSHETVTEQRCR